MKFEQYKALRGQLLEKMADGATVDTMPAPLVLAWLGDGTFSLYVRKRLLAAETNKVRVLNDVSAAMVSAVMQAKALQALLPELTEAEHDMVRRGRNTKSAVPKSASMGEYRQSTGFECLLGWLCWQGQEKRLDKIMGDAFAVIIRHMNSLDGNGGLVE